MSIGLRNTFITCLSVLVVVLVRGWLGGQMGDMAPFSPFYITVMLGAFLGGFRLALLAFVLSFTANAMLFSSALYAEGLGDTMMTFSLYTLVSISIAYMGEALHREKRRAQEKADQLLISEERSQRAQSAARVAMWESDLVAGGFHYSPEFTEMYGVQKGPMTMDQSIELLHPDDREAVITRFQQTVATREEEWVSTSRFIHPETGVRWQFTRARIEYDDAGRAIRMSGTAMDVTEQRVIEERSSRAQEVARAGTWELDLVEQKAYLSAEFCRLVCLAPRPWFTLDEVFKIAHPADEPRVRAEFERTITGRQRDYLTEHRNVLPDGQVKWRLSRGRVEYSSDGKPLSIVGATMDVTDRKVAELALLRSEQRFRLAADAINGMIYDQDKVTGSVQRSEGLFDLTGVHAADAPPVEPWWVARIHPDDLTQLMPVMEMVHGERQPLFDLEYRVLHENGHWVWVSDKGRLVYNEEGYLTRVVGCTTDISVRKKAEMELQDSDRRKDEFIATLAHELRNPLSPLQHAVDLLEDIAEDRQMLSDLRSMMERQMRHLVRLVDDLLDIGRISQGKIDLRMDRIDLADCVRTAVEANRHMLERMQHQLKVVLPAGPCVVTGDHERLTQVVSNLLNNSIKFTPANGQIDLLVQCGPQSVQLIVKDNGIGLEPGALDRIFEMFVQNSRGSHGGLGIGLNLVRRLVVMHGGTVIAKSDGPGKGATIQIELPIHAAHDRIEPLDVGRTSEPSLSF